MARPTNLNKTDFDLAKLLRTTAEQFRAAANEKGIEITLNLMESPITAYYDRLKQVFINLLSNALKYTDRGGVTIAIEEGRGSHGLVRQGRRRASPTGTSAAQPSPAHWEVVIADTGIGIPESDLPHIFERLYRSDKSRSRSTGGAGIGLTIAAAIVHAHGGTISAENRSEIPDAGGNGSSSGTVFRVML